MKKLVSFLALFVAITCFAQSLPAAQQEYKDYVESNIPLARRGELPWSTYYKGLYSRLVALNAPGDMLERGSRLIRDAELYESGKIDQIEFDFRRRNAQSEQATSDQVRQNAARAQVIAEQQESAAREQQRSNNALVLAAQLLQAGTPKVLASPQQAPPASTLQMQTINGMVRTCQYWNGRIINVTVTTMCPMQSQ